MNIKFDIMGQLTRLPEQVNFNFNCRSILSHIQAHFHEVTQHGVSSDINFKFNPHHKTVLTVSHC
jgi:hypothetical protein